MRNKKVKANGWEVYIGTSYLDATNYGNIRDDGISVSIGLGSKTVRIHNIRKKIILEIDINKMEIKKESEE